MKVVNVVRGFVLIGIAGATIGVADARPFAIDVHGASCQAAFNPTAVQYDDTGVQSLSNTVKVVCPLNAIAMQSDGTTQAQVKIQIKMYTTGSMSCTFQATVYGGSSQTLLFTPTAGTFSTAQVSPVDEPVYPHDGTMPTEVSLTCTLATTGSTIGSIQIETVPV